MTNDEKLKAHVLARVDILLKDRTEPLQPVRVTQEEHDALLRLALRSEDFPTVYGTPVVVVRNL